jgi:MOSC domain-containing protein YiiM
MAGLVEGIFLAPEARAEMRSVQAATALEGCGLEGDRYCAETGHWSRFGRVCEVTFIAAEDLDDIERETGVGVKHGEHRRNVVLRGVNLGDLRRRRFRIGEATLEYVGPRSVCRYIERLTEPGMTQALKGRGGICARVIENGTVRVGDELECCSPMRSVHRGNGLNDEQNTEDTLTSGVLQEALVNMPLSVILECEATRSTQRRPRPVQVPYTPQVNPIPSTVVSEQGAGTASLQ